MTPLARPRSRVSDWLLSLAGLRFIVWLAVARAWLLDVFALGGQISAHFDEHFYFLHEDAARIAMVDHGELASWNPYFCGGIPGLGNPQDVSLSPDFLLRIVFGTAVGRRLAVVLFVVLGMEGTYRWARRHDASTIGSALAAVAFATSARFAGLVHDGWIHMFAFQLMPFAALAFEEGFTCRGYRLFGGFVLAWMVLCGGTYVVPYTGLLLALLLAVAVLFARAGLRREALRGGLASLATIVAVSAALSAPRVLPMLAVIREHPRFFQAPEATPVVDVIAALALPASAKDFVARFGLGEPGYNHVGTLTCVLAIFAFARLDRRALAFGLLVVAFCALACGDRRPFSSWSLLHMLPIFKQLRTPFRLLVVAGLVVSLSAARGITRIEDAPMELVRWLRARRGQGPISTRASLAIGVGGASVALALAVVAAVQAVSGQILHVGDAYEMKPPEQWRSEFRQARGNRWEAHLFPAASRGSLACFEETAFPQSEALRGDRDQEEFVLEGDARVTRVRWSPTRIVVRVSAREPFLLGVNQNFHRSWRASAGEVVSSSGLLAVRAPAGDYELELAFRDRLIDVGVVIALAAIVALAAAVAVAAKRRLRVARRLFRVRGALGVRG